VYFPEHGRGRLSRAAREIVLRQFGILGSDERWDDMLSQRFHDARRRQLQPAARLYADSGGEVTSLYFIAPTNVPRIALEVNIDRGTARDRLGLRFEFEAIKALSESEILSSATLACTSPVHMTPKATNKRTA